MPDKTFNEEPMITVVSDSLDPRAKRQLQSQLQSTMMSVSELTAELQNQQALQDIKAQKDASKDQTEFDDDATDNKEPPKAIENDPDNKQDNQPESNPDQGSGSEADPFSDEQNAGVQEGGDQNVDQPKTQSQENGEGVQNAQQNTQAPNSGDQSAEQNQQQPTNSNGQEGQAQNQANASQAQQAQQNDQQQPAQAPQQQDQGNAQPSGGENGEADPFGDDNVNFEAFAGVLGFGYKTESADQTEESDLPPIKSVVMIKGGDQGVDNRTASVVASIEDPENTVVILELSEVLEVEAKMQFRALTRQLQQRNIMVVESIDQAVEYLNDVYEELAGNK